MYRYIVCAYFSLHLKFVQMYIYGEILSLDWEGVKNPQHSHHWSSGYFAGAFGQKSLFESKSLVIV